MYRFQYTRYELSDAELGKEVPAVYCYCHISGCNSEEEALIRLKRYFASCLANFPAGNLSAGDLYFTFKLLGREKCDSLSITV